MTTTTMSPLVEKQFHDASRKVLIDNMLTESEGLTTLKVLEEGATSGLLIVEGKIGQCGVPTANKRLYERSIMEREVKRLQEKIERRAALAAVDHPGDGKSRVREAGAICLGLRVEADGAVWGRYEIVEESSGGKDLAAFLRRGCAIGMSSRGIGSTRLDSSGNHVVGEDFKLHGFDFVADPACREAFPKLVSEDIDPETVSENELRVRFPSLVEQIEDRARQAGAEVAGDDAREVIEREFTEQVLPEARERLQDDIRIEVLAEVREALRDDFAAKLLSALQGVKDEARSIVKSELLSDPSVAGAKQFMEELAERLTPYRPSPDQQALMDSHEGALAQLREQVEQLTDARNGDADKIAETEKKARSLGFRLYVERALSPYEHSDHMRLLVGDPDKFATVEELQKHVTGVIRQVSETNEAAQGRADVAVKVEEHKTQLAATKAQRLDEQLERVRTEFSARLNTVADNLRRRIDEKDGLLTDAAETIDRLEQRAHAASRSAQQSDLLAYTTRRTVGHPRQADIMAAVESGRASTKTEVRQLAEQWDHRGDEPGGASERIRRSLGKGREAPTESEHDFRQQITEDTQPIPGLEQFDTTMGEIKRLAGLGQNNGRRRF